MYDYTLFMLHLHVVQSSSYTQPTCASFLTHTIKTKHWRTLYENDIPYIKTVKKSPFDTAFVVIDAEPWDGNDFKPPEIGLTLLPLLNSNSSNLETLPKVFGSSLL